MRILFMANAPWAKTGYGVQGKHLTAGWQAQGHAVTYFPFYGLQGGALNFNGVALLPLGLDPWGNDIIQAHCKASQAEVLITLMDIWVQEAYGTLQDVSWCPWMPIDADPCPPPVAEKMWGARRVITYAKFGLRKARELGVDADYIPHGIDPTMFHPGDKVAARKRVGLPQEAHVTAIVAANKGQRKALAENIAAWAEFRKEHPEAVLYLHTLAGPQHGGTDLGPLLKHLQLPDNSVYLADQYRYVVGALEAEYMAAVYQGADVLLAASTSEGFGVPILEAQACGCPVITTNFTSMPELTWYGATVDPVQLFWMPLASWQAVPSMPGITQALRALYDMPAAEHEKRRWPAILKAQREYAWDVLLEQHWQPFLADLEAELRGDQPPKLTWPARDDWKKHVWPQAPTEPKDNEPQPDSGGTGGDAIRPGEPVPLDSDSLPG